MHYRVRTYDFNSERFDDMMAYADSIKDQVRNIEGLNFSHVCRTSETGAVIVAQNDNEEAMEDATPRFREIMVGMAQFFTSPPNPVGAEVIWQSDH
jgi:hypothetical protein